MALEAHGVEARVTPAYWCRAVKTNRPEILSCAMIQLCYIHSVLVYKLFMSTLGIRSNLQVAQVLTF
jgi:hypothetical protein